MALDMNQGEAPIVPVPMQDQVDQVEPIVLSEEDPTDNINPDTDDETPRGEILH